MSRPATGSARWNKTRKMWMVHVTVKGRRQPPIPMHGIAQNDVEGARKLAAEVSERVRDRGMVPAECSETVAEWSKRWLDDRDERGVASNRDNKGHIEHHVTAEIGHLPMLLVTREEIERLVETLDKKVHHGELAWKSAKNVWATVTKMFDDAVSSKTLDVRVPGLQDPTKEVRGPDGGDDRAKQFLFPSEFLRFASCAEVPIEWRQLVAVAIYMYPRDGELRVLDWEDVDLVHGVVHIHRAWQRRTKSVGSTKSGGTRRFTIEPTLLPLLQLLKKQSGRVLEMPSERTMARGLRRWLKNANVTRAALHTNTSTTRQITFHDLRATGITWLAIRGDEPLKIQQRAGHSRFDTTQGYIREAENLRDGFGEVFPALPASLVGSAPNCTSANDKEKKPTFPWAYSGVDGTRKSGGMVEIGTSEERICAAIQRLPSSLQDACNLFALIQNVPPESLPTDTLARLAVALSAAAGVAHHHLAERASVLRSAFSLAAGDDE